jgi:hypothetical protein
MNTLILLLSMDQNPTRYEVAAIFANRDRQERRFAARQMSEAERAAAHAAESARVEKFYEQQEQGRFLKNDAAERARAKEAEQRRLGG